MFGDFNSESSVVKEIALSGYNNAFLKFFPWDNLYIFILLFILTGVFGWILFKLLGLKKKSGPVIDIF